MEERQIELAAYGLRRSEDRLPFEMDGGLAWLLGELKEWLDDDRQWLSPHTDQWLLLLDDLLRARTRAGTALQAHLGDRARDWDEIAACRMVLARQKKSRTPDPSLRRRLIGATGRLRAELLRPGALVAVFEGLLASRDYLAAREGGARFRELSDVQGLDTERLIKTLSAILEDEQVAVKEARQETLEKGDLRRSAGLDRGEKVALCRERLAELPRRVDAVVWLKYVLAPFRAGHLDIGEVVRIYSADWLQRAIKERRSEELPDEFADEIFASDLAALAGIAEEEEEAVGGRARTPVALVRVALGEVESDSAVELARETSELLVSLSVLLGTDPRIWLLTKSWVRSYDGRRSGGSFHAPPVATPSFEHHRAMESDAMAEFVEEWGERLATHLPPRGDEVRRVGRLALWLRHSRESWDPGRIVLSGRVLEQVAGWAGLADRYQFGDEFLRLSWALRRVHLEVDNCWRGIWAAHADWEQDFSPNGWEEIAAEPDIEYTELADGRYSFNRAGVLRKMEFLLERLRPGSTPHERLARLHQDADSGQATAAWVKRLEKDFDVFAKRERRIRNALIHGGAVSETLPESAVLFTDWLAADALHAAIEGTLAGIDLVDHFLEFRAKREVCKERLEAGVAPSEALFWGGG